MRVPSGLQVVVVAWNGDSLNGDRASDLIDELVEDKYGDAVQFEDKYGDVV
jgi:hypothetical protein